MCVIGKVFQIRQLFSFINDSVDVRHVYAETCFLTLYRVVIKCNSPSVKASLPYIKPSASRCYRLYKT